MSAEHSSHRSPLEDLVIGGLDDWVDMGWAMNSARLTGEAGYSRLRDITLDLIRDALLRGLMVAGDVGGGRARGVANLAQRDGRPYSRRVAH